MNSEKAQAMSRTRGIVSSFRPGLVPAAETILSHFITIYIPIDLTFAGTGCLYYFSSFALF